MLVGALVACGNSRASEVPAASKTLEQSQAAYPIIETSVTGYPAQVTGDVFRTPEPPTDVPLPSRGNGVVSGVLYSANAQMLIPGTLLYLTPAIGAEKRGVPPIISGPNDAEGDIRGISNDKGQFILSNVPPGNYYLVVSSPLSWSLAEIAETGQPRLIEVVPDTIIALGVVYLSWP